MEKKRYAWIDIAKALGIILIVVGHGLNYKHVSFKYIYWFHVPLFFIISGTLHTQHDSIYSFISRRFKHLMVPYCTYLLIYVVFMSIGICGEIPIYKILLGGKFLINTNLAIYWFVPCLLATQIVSFLILKIDSVFMRFCTVIIFYLGAIILQYIFTDTFGYFMFNSYFSNNTIILPLSFEVVPMAVVFYVMGFSLAKSKLQLSGILTIALAVFFGFIIYLDNKRIIDIPHYVMYLQQYSLPIINIILPAGCFLIIRQLSISIEKHSVLRGVFMSIGQASMTILFTHVILANGFIYLLYVFFDYKVAEPQVTFLWIILGLILPYLAYSFFKPFSLTRKFFLGISD